MPRKVLRRRMSGAWASYVLKGQKHCGESAGLVLRLLSSPQSLLGFAEIGLMLPGSSSEFGATADSERKLHSGVPRFSVLWDATCDARSFISTTCPNGDLEHRAIFDVGLPFGVKQADSRCGGLAS